MIACKEKALNGSKKKNFPNSIHLLCDEHQKENLASKCKYTEKDDPEIHKEIMHLVMSVMAGADSPEVFQNAKEEVKTKYGDAFNGNYFENFANTLWKYEVEPRLRFPRVIPKYAKTNSIEANNSRAKRYTEHTPRTLYEAILLMKEMVQTCLDNMIQALLGEGPWKIALGSKLKRIDKAAWARKSPEVQMKEFLRIVCGVTSRQNNKRKAPEPEIATLNLSNGVKKKKNQRTRCQANRAPANKNRFNLDE